MITNNQTITLVNTRREGREKVFFSTVFNGVNVVKLVKNVKTEKGYVPASTFSIRIPFKSIKNCGKEFINADEFNRKQNDVVDGFFTIASGDYIIFGVASKEIDLEMLTTDNNVHKIIDCADNTSALTTACKHIRIFCDEH